MGFHEIGSDFWQINIENRESQQLWWEDSQYQRSYFKSGRNAIKALCQLLSKTGKKALLPIYTCKTVIQPFLEEGWSVRFYQIHKDMSVNMENLLDMVNAFQPTVVYLQSYFGFDTLNFGADFIAEMHNKNIVVVEDITQSLFSEHFIKGADYYVTSFRKFFAVPDGGGLFSKNGCTELDCMSADSEITRIAFEAFDKKREYMKNPSVEKKQEFRQLYALLNNRFSDNSVVRKMSQDSLDILEKCNKDIIRKKRVSNYTVLQESLSEIEILSCVLGCPQNTETPLYLPVYVKKHFRTDLQNKLAQHGIYCPVIWPQPKEVYPLDTNSEYMYGNMLCFPIDQRYDSEDMDRIIDVLKEIL